MIHSTMPGAATVQVKCQCCKQPFTARVADRARGWGKFCSKSCKAIRQTQNGGGNSRLPRPNGITPMLYKDCQTCGAPAVNGARDAGGHVEWYCRDHEYEARLHPSSSEALGQG